MFDIGERIKNKNTDIVWTVVAVELAIPNVTVWEIANDAFETVRFNQDYLSHYERYNPEEEEE